MAKRKGAASTKSVDVEVLRRLNAGTLETATLSETLAMDFAALMAAAFPSLEREAVEKMRSAADQGVTKRMALAASLLSSHLGGGAFEVLNGHASDTVRGWAAFVLGVETAPLEEKLERIRPLADDPHFGVREWAWLALRPEIAAEIEAAIALLVPWTGEASENLRRFAVESTRPRGVWSAHIFELKQRPSLGEALLDGVMADPSRYVQNSCGNWLNDAAKSDAVWVRSYCDGWLAGAPDEATAYIVKRALRSLA